MRAVCLVMGLLMCITWSAALECPEGTTLQSVGGTDDTPLFAEFCKLPSGKMHGTALRYYPDGQRSHEDNWNHGVASGTWSQWREKGSLWRQWEYDAGKKNGPYAEWDEAGKQRIWGYFVEGEEHGLWVMHVSDDDYGVVIVVFENGDDVTEGLLRNIPASCEEWQSLSGLQKQGLIAVHALKASSGLEGIPGKLLEDRVLVARRIAHGSDSTPDPEPGACTDINSWFIDTTVGHAANSILGRTRLPEER